MFNICWKLLSPAASSQIYYINIKTSYFEEKKMMKIYNKYIIAVQSMITGTIDVGFTLILASKR